MIRTNAKFGLRLTLLTLALMIGLIAGGTTARADNPTTTATPVYSGKSNGSDATYGIGTEPRSKPATTAPTDVAASIYGVSCKISDSHRVVFMVDTSGSMIGVFADLKANLKKAILAMPFGKGRFVEFDIVTFSDEKEPRVFSKTIGDKQQLMIDNPETVKKAIEFVDDTVASGGTVAMPAISSVLAMEPLPDTIFFMTDGIDDPDRFGDIGDAFRAATSGGKLAVNCIHFKSEADPKLEDLLKLIAKESRGEFKQIEKSDMQ